MSDFVRGVDQVAFRYRGAPAAEQAAAIATAIAGITLANGIVHQQVTVGGVDYKAARVRDGVGMPGTERFSLLIGDRVLAVRPCVGDFDAPRTLLETATAAEVATFLSHYREVAQAFSDRVAHFKDLGGLLG